MVRKLKESIDLTDYERVHSHDSNYAIYRKTLRDGNGKITKGIWAAQRIDGKTDKPIGEPFEITYDQARGFEPIEGANFGKIVGKALGMPIRRENKQKCDEDFATGRLKDAGYTGTVFYDNRAMNNARKNLNEVQRLLKIASDNQIAATSDTRSLCKEFETFTNDLLVTIRYILDSYERD